MNDGFEQTTGCSMAAALKGLGGVEDQAFRSRLSKYKRSGTWMRSRSTRRFHPLEAEQLTLVLLAVPSARSEAGSKQ